MSAKKKEVKTEKEVVKPEVSPKEEKKLVSINAYFAHKGTPMLSQAGMKAFAKQHKMVKKAALQAWVELFKNY